MDCGSGKWGQTFTFDAFGNVTKTGTSRQGTSFTPGYNAATNQFSASNYHFDSNGNLLGDGVNNYIWDADANLSQFNGGTASVYDALSRRVEQTNASGTNEILYGPDGKLALMSGTAVTKAFVPLPGGATAVYNSSTLAWYRHPDWLGSSRIASTPSRTVSYDGAASYSPFGESPTETGDHSFTGQNQDLAPNFLYDFPAREYHPGESRWLSPDPAGVTAVDPTNPQSWNRYAYVNGSPLNSVDPSGLTPVFGYTPAECNGKNACADAAFHSSLAAGGVYNLSLAGIGDIRFQYTPTEVVTPGPYGDGVVTTEVWPADQSILINLSFGGAKWVSIGGAKRPDSGTQMACAGTARVLKGNAAQIGHPGGWSGRTVGRILVTRNGVAIIPGQWGVTNKGPFRQYLNQISGSAPGTGVSFQGVSEIIGGGPDPNFPNLPVQQGLMADYPGNLILELPGGRDLGITPVNLSVPRAVGCPAGTTVVPQ